MFLKMCHIIFLFPMVILEITGQDTNNIRRIKRPSLSDPGPPRSRHPRKDIVLEVYSEAQPRPPWAQELYSAEYENTNSKNDGFNEYGTSEEGSSHSSSNELTLDDIISSAKGQEIILNEAQKRINNRMDTVIDQVSEEIIESLEGDAGAALVAEKEDASRAQSFTRNLTSPLHYISSILFLYVTQHLIIRSR